MKIRIGTRKSALALRQTAIVVQEIKKYFPEYEIIIVPIITTGDKITNKNLYDIGGKALFLQEIEAQLVNNQIDIAVHSLKDVPGILPTELEIAAVLPREDPRDCLISYNGIATSIHDLPLGTVLGTSSVRRRVVVQKAREDIQIVQFRGNVDTRLRKLINKEVDTTILACAGLHRMGLFDPAYCFPISISNMLPAAGQGIICVEIKKRNEQMQQLCMMINHTQTWIESQAERSFVKYLEASCRTPIAAYARVIENRIIAHYMLSSIDGQQIEFLDVEGSVDKAVYLGIQAAQKLKTRFLDYDRQVVGSDNAIC